VVLERDFQTSLIKKIKEIFPGAVILKNDPNYIQGIPDLIVLHNDRWAALECKKSSACKHQPNQDYYVDILNTMSYAAFVSPENEEEVLHELQQSLGA
jgi:hypothetical protein